MRVVKFVKTTTVHVHAVHTAVQSSSRRSMMIVLRFSVCFTLARNLMGNSFFPNLWASGIIIDNWWPSLDQVVSTQNHHNSVAYTRVGQCIHNHFITSHSHIKLIPIKQGIFSNFSWHNIQYVFTTPMLLQLKNVFEIISLRSHPCLILLLTVFLFKCF